MADELSIDISAIWYNLILFQLKSTRHKENEFSNSVLAAEEETADALRVRCWEDNSFCIQSKVLLDGIRTVAPQVGAQDSCLLHGKLLKEQNAAAFDMNAIETITEAE